METRELKRNYEKIGKTYTDKVLSGYIDFFSNVLNSIKDKRNREYRINALRLKVYKRLLRSR